MSPTQELIACILRKQSSPIYVVLERTELLRKKKSAVEEDQQKAEENKRALRTAEERKA